MEKLPTTITQTFYIQARRAPFEDQHTISLFSTDMSEHGYIPLGTEEITVSVPQDTDLVTAEVDMLKQRQQEVRANAQMEVNQIQERINSLQALDHKPAP